MKKCLKELIFYSLLLLLSMQSTAQHTLSLEEAVTMGQSQSLYYHRLKNSFEKSYWRYNNFQALFKPKIRLNATIPTFYRAIIPITQPDGSIQFHRVSQANNSVGLNLVQNVGFLGGSVVAGTSLRRTDNFSGSESSYFLSTPIQFSYQQSSLLYNDFSWGKKIEPVLFELAKKEYTEEMESLALEIAELFFNAIQWQRSVDIAISNLSYSDTLLKISRERAKIGSVSKTDVLQLELNSLNAKKRLNELLVTYQSANRTLKKYLNIPQSDSLVLIVPTLGSTINISYEVALEQAMLNRKNITNFEFQRLIADKELAKAKGQNSIELSLLANIGTQQSAASLGNAYKNLQNQQYIGLTVDIPISDWGYRKSQIRMAKRDRELVDLDVEQDLQNLEQEIYLQVLNFNQQISNLMISLKAESLAQERLAMSRERYLMGKVGIVDLNLALQENINAKEQVLNSIKSYWISFYTIRKLTLFDFVKQLPIKYTPTLNLTN